MDVFRFRDQVIGDYADFVRSFIAIRDGRIETLIDDSFRSGALWPDALVQLNPAFEPGAWIDELVREGVLHPDCSRIFRKHRGEKGPELQGLPLRLHRHQEEAVRAAKTGASYVLTTGTGSGKSLAYIAPIVDHVLRSGPGRGIQAIVVYPMNALANSQAGELEKFLKKGFSNNAPPVTFAKYTGQEPDEEKQQIISSPPDILLTNYVMLELLLTRPKERKLVEAARGLRFVVLDELHTYRGRQGADVAFLARRVSDALSTGLLQFVGTSATLAGPGSADEQRRETAQVASLLFGREVRPECVIGETLRRLTAEHDESDSTFETALRARVENSASRPPRAFSAFTQDPLSSWIESTFGLAREPGGGRLVRAQPRSLDGEDGAAILLSKRTGLPQQRCADSVRETLLAGYTCEPDPETGFPPFAFRLHQFVSRGDTVYASLESEADRYLTLNGQRFVPGSRDRLLLPLVFCRECGQEYYSVWRVESEAGLRFEPRPPSERSAKEEGQRGYLFLSSEDPWPDTFTADGGRVPEDWFEPRRDGPRVKSSRRPDLPVNLGVSAAGIVDAGAQPVSYVKAPFRFCLACGVTFGGRSSLDDYSRLGTLGTEGRSSATTTLSLDCVRELRRDEALPPVARKLLSFTDNRQDASLQAGHFNDFVEIAILRAAIYKAVVGAGAEGLRDENLTQRVFESIALPFADYASNPAARFRAREDTDRSLREVLGYRIFRDLKRGWRIVAPNLEQCGLLEIQYRSLDDLCSAQDVWEKLDPCLADATAETRTFVCRTLLDHMRRELCLKVPYLDRRYQETLRQLSYQNLRAPWALDESEAEDLEHASILFPRGRKPDDSGEYAFLSGRGGFGQFLRRESTFGRGRSRPQNVDQSEVVIRQLLASLAVAGLVEAVIAEKDELPGYLIPSAALVWLPGSGKGMHDPIRVPRAPSEGLRPNVYFQRLYRDVALEFRGLEAREHTAQVPTDRRIEREDRFRKATLPVLYCSPTMELGVDISELNVVNLRNVPPTPANYAQRSGRAGRSGQPAFVLAYCATGNSHDQYFFRRPAQMVSGVVSPPRLDLANEDLVRAHIHAIWLAETGCDLGKSLQEVVDLEGDDPSLALLPSKAADISSGGARTRARERADKVLASVDDLDDSGWYTREWPSQVLSRVELEFEQALDRWRGLYRTALTQAKAQSRVILDQSRSENDRQQARRLRAEAEAQLKLLTSADQFVQSDFFSYRYFASEGFLPGYSFPRLPLSAFIPGRRDKSRDEFLSRPRFLAISEFGPRAVVYHEGSRYFINKVNLPVGDEDPFAAPTTKICGDCAYLHSTAAALTTDRCERCGSANLTSHGNLLRLQNVSTRRRDRISSDEEERLRLGYELKTAVRFADHGAAPTRRAEIQADGRTFATLAFGQAATVWRLNLGWTRRSDKSVLGFVIDKERGYWQRDQSVDDAPEDAFSAQRARVIPFVDDRKNCLLVEPADRLPAPVMASLQAALKRAIQVRYQLEENELAAEPLPSEQDRRLILLYESAEGGAGVLRRLVDDVDALPAVALTALDLCHFDATGEDLETDARGHERCEAACYDCLLSYSNQRDHKHLDRATVRDVLLLLARGTIHVAPGPRTREQHLAGLERLCDSDLERRWLRRLEAHNLRLPTRAQALLANLGTRPDFIYDEDLLVIYVDGPVHDYPDRHARDQVLTERLEDAGYTVLRFGHDDDWDNILARFPAVFGAFQPGSNAPKAPALDLDLFDARWHSLLGRLAATPGIQVTAGKDVVNGGQVIGTTLADVRSGDAGVYLVDSSAPSEEALRTTFESRGERCLVVGPGSDEENLPRILAALGGPA